MVTVAMKNVCLGSNIQPISIINLEGEIQHKQMAALPLWHTRDHLYILNRHITMGFRIE